MFDWMKRHVLAWTTTAAATLTAFQVFAPKMVDWILDIIVVVLVWVAAKLAKVGNEKK